MYRGREQVERGYIIGRDRGAESWERGGRGVGGEESREEQEQESTMVHRYLWRRHDGERVEDAVRILLAYLAHQ